MFIRWKTHARGQSATVLRAIRIDGKPRQQVVVHLGLLEHDWTHSPEHLVSFWLSVDARVAALEVNPDEKAQLLAQVEARVPRPGRAGFAGVLDEVALLEAARKLCHPDRHPPERAQLANWVTAGLNRMLEERRRRE